MSSDYVIKKWFEKVFAGVCSRAGNWSVVRGKPSFANNKKGSIASGNGTAADPIAHASNIEVATVEESMTAETGPDGESILPCPEHGPEAVPGPKKRQRRLTGLFKKPSWHHG